MTCNAITYNMYRHRTYISNNKNYLLSLIYTQERVATLKYMFFHSTTA